jgi:uroporphyrinogen III methyltransferase/synthase
VKVAAIGPATSAALWKRGVRADVVPSEYRGEAVADAIRQREGELAHKRILIARAEVAREVMPRMLRDAGATVDVVAAYRTLPAEPARFAEIARLLREGAIDTIAFTSSSTVERLIEGLGEGGSALVRRARVAAIGPITADTAARLDAPADVVATEYTAPGLVQALVEDALRRRT